MSTALVFDLSTMDAALNRMELLAATLVDATEKPSVAARQLLNTLVCGLLEDTRISGTGPPEPQPAGPQNRRTHRPRRRTLHCSRPQGILADVAGRRRRRNSSPSSPRRSNCTSSRVSWPPFVEGILVGTNYAISFLLLQIFGLALATKQPSMTAATLADIIRHNRGVSRRDKIADFAASISRTQLAAAFGNVLAVCGGAVVFNMIWLHITAPLSGT